MAELRAGRSGRPWREAVLHELRGLRNAMAGSKKSLLPMGADHLPYLGEDQQHEYERAKREHAIKEASINAQ